MPGKNGQGTPRCMGVHAGFPSTSTRGSKKDEPAPISTVWLELGWAAGSLSRRGPQEFHSQVGDPSVGFLGKPKGNRPMSGVQAVFVCLVFAGEGKTKTKRSFVFRVQSRIWRQIHICPTPQVFANLIACWALQKMPMSKDGVQSWRNLLLTACRDSHKISPTCKKGPQKKNTHGRRNPRVSSRNLICLDPAMDSACGTQTKLPFRQKGLLNLGPPVESLFL